MQFKNRIKILLIFWFIFYFFSSSYSQPRNLDSLLHATKNAKHDTIKVKAFVSLSNLYRNSNPDSALFFGEQGLKLAEKNKWEKGISLCYKSLGLAHFETSRYEKAIECFHHSLNIDEKDNNLKGMAICYNYIGGVYNDQNQLEKAEEYYKKSLELREKIGDKKGIAASYNNIGLVYYNKKDFQKALEFYTMSLKLKEGTNDKYGLAGSYNNVGLVHSELGDNKLALDFYKKSYILREEIGDKKGVSAILGNMALLNIDLANATNNVTEKKIYFTEAVRYGKECLVISEELDALLWKNKTAEVLMKSYKGLGDVSNSLKYAELFIETSDSLYKEDKVKAIEEIDAKYQTEKKEKQIELQQIHIEKQDVEAKQHRTFIYAVSTGLFLVLLLLFVAFYAYRQKRKANILLTKQKKEIEEKNEELNQQKEEITAQRDEIENQRDQILERNEELNQKNEEIATQRDEIISQRDILSGQNKILKEQKRNITDSIIYAKRIQKALFSKEELFQQVFSEHFVFFKPRDIVSGDFFWCSIIDDWVIFCVADCTGHGVPGAFMSVLGISFLNEISKNKEIKAAAQALDLLQSSIIESLHQKEKMSNQPSWTTVMDGMDIALCALNKKTMELHFAGANNPLYIVKTGYYPAFTSPKPLQEVKADSSPGTLYEVKGDKQPIGMHDHSEPFTNHIIQLQKGDTIYLFSDGFMDQFGGEKGVKFKSKPFKKLIADIAHLTLAEQKKILETTFENWINHISAETDTVYEQTDDVTVLGIRI